MGKKYTVDELTRLAFIHAEADRREMAECDSSEYGRQALELAKEMRAYRLKRWGRTTLEASLEEADLLPLSEISRTDTPGEREG